MKKLVTSCDPDEPNKNRFLAGLLIPIGIDRYPQLKSVLPCPNTWIVPDPSLTMMNVKMSVLLVGVGGEPPDHLTPFVTELPSTLQPSP